MIDRYPPPRTNAIVSALAVLLLCGWLAACATTSNNATSTNHIQTQQSPDDEPQQLSNTDPCATQLHDLCGGILFHLAQHGQLPAQLSDLEPIPGVHGAVNLQCPDSGLAYIYDRVGLLTPDHSGRIHVYDASPAHLGFRWAIKITHLREDLPPIARVIALPEAFFNTR